MEERHYAYKIQYIFFFVYIYYRQYSNTHTFNENFGWPNWSDE